MNIKAQNFFDHNLTDKEVKRITLNPLLEAKLTSDLILQDYPNLEEVYILNHEITSLTITNCPNLKEINVYNNQLTKLEIEGANKLAGIIAGQNELISLDLTHCPTIKELIIPDNPYLTQIKGLNLSNIKNINIINTQINLAQEIDELKEKNKKLSKTLKEIESGVAQKQLVLTEPIQTAKQVEEAILRHLKKVEKEWREYLNNPKEALPDFQIPTQRKKAKQILIWTIEAQTDGDYQKLVKKWNGGDDYNAEYDFDGSLHTLMQLLKMKDGINQNNLIYERK